MSQLALIHRFSNIFAICLGFWSSLLASLVDLQLKFPFSVEKSYFWVSSYFDVKKFRQELFTSSSGTQQMSFYLFSLRHCHYFPSPIYELTFKSHLSPTLISMWYGILSDMMWAIQLAFWHFASLEMCLCDVLFVLVSARQGGRGDYWDSTQYCPQLWKSTTAQWQIFQSNISYKILGNCVSLVLSNKVVL